MRIGYPLLDKLELSTPRNASIYRDATAHVEGAVLLTVAVLGGIGNLFLLVVTATCLRVRTTSCAFLSHHCLLDTIKSLFCVPFAAALLLGVDIPYCNVLGASYIFLMTLTAYNLLAIHINEEFQQSGHHEDTSESNTESNGQQTHHSGASYSFCCISFGIFMIWFTTILLHLGVAFLPSSAEFSYNIGNCVFNYGTPKNYVIHILWTLLVTVALATAIISFAKLYCRLRAHMHSEQWTMLHASISHELHDDSQGTSSENPHGSHTHHDREANNEELHYEFAEGMDQTAVQQMQLCLRRVMLMLLMAVSFLVFWYPLFLLTIIDVHYHQPPQVYRACMIFAWSHPITTPIFCAIICSDINSSHKLAKAAYTNAIPLKESSSFSSSPFAHDEARQRINQKYKMYEMGFANENFSSSNHGSPGLLHNIGKQSTSSCPAADSETHTTCHSCPEQSSIQTLIM